MSQSITAVALVVDDYEAVHFFTRLRFAVVEDTQLPGGKRLVTVRQPGGGTALLLAKAAGPAQAARVGDQTGGRVFLQTDDFWRDYHDLRGRGVRFAEEPGDEGYGTVAVSLDLYGNRWDLLRPPPAEASVLSSRSNDTRPSARAAGGSHGCVPGTGRQGRLERRPQ